MTKPHFALACAAVCFFAFTAFSQKTSARSDVVPGRYIVVLSEKYANSNMLADETALLVNEVASDYGASVDKIYSSALQGFSAQMSEGTASALSTDARVRYIEPDRMMSVSSSQTNAPWNLDRVDQRNLPWNGIYNYTGTGAGVHVYIIDTGIRITHTEFGGRASVSFDAVGDGQNGLDCNGHGTHVAGLAGSTTWGVAKGAYLHAVRVLGCSGTGLLSNVLAGVDWVKANHASPAVANISATVSGASLSLETAITNSIASGVVYTIAAGNDASDACGYTPARTPDALTIGASDETDLRALYSNYGSCVDMFAPGNQIDSTWASSDTAIHNLSGSSMAAPMVAGAAAIYLEANPTVSASGVAVALKVAATTGVLTTNDPTSPNMLLYSQIGLAPTSAPATVSGRVTLNGRGLRKVAMSLTDLMTGTIKYALTSFSGSYQFTEVETGRTYLLTAAPGRRYQIASPTRILTITDNIAGLDFVAENANY